MASPINSPDPANYPTFITKEKRHWFKSNEIRLPDAEGKEVWVKSSAEYHSLRTPHRIVFGAQDENGTVRKEYRYVDLGGIIPREYINRGATTIGKALAAKRIFHRLEQLGYKKSLFESAEQCIDLLLSLPDTRDALQKLSALTSSLESGEPLTKDQDELRIFLFFKPEIDRFGLSINNSEEFSDFLLKSAISKKELQEAVDSGDPKKRFDLTKEIAAVVVFHENSNILPVLLSSEKQFTSLVLNQKGNFAQLRLLSKVPAFFIQHAAIFQKYDIKQEVALTNYFLHHVSEMDILRKESADPYFVELLCERIHNMTGLESFYYTNATGLKDYGWFDLTTFIQDMELANMSLSKLVAMTKRDNYKEDLKALKERDIPLYKENEKLFKKANVSFQRYLQFIQVKPELREQLEKLQDLPGDEFENEFIAALKDEKAAWTDRTYDQYRSDAIDELWRKVPQGQWVRTNPNPDAADHHAVVASRQMRRFDPSKKPAWSKAHYVEIIAHAQNLLERGNLPGIMRIYKESTGLARTYTVDPKKGRIIIHIKQKNVDKQASYGSFKKVSTAIVIEKGKAPEIVADFVIYANPGQDPMEAQAEFETLAQLQDDPNIPRIIRDINSSPGRMYCTQEIFTIRDLREAFAYPLDERLRLMIGVLKGLRHLFSKGKVHKDVKLENMSCARGLGLPFDFGLAVDRGVISGCGTRTYMYPLDYKMRLDALNRQIEDEEQLPEDRKPLPQPPSSIVADLWGFGIALYEILSTPANASKEQAILPRFLVKIQNQVAKYKADKLLQNGKVTKQDIYNAYHYAFAALKQRQVDDDIASFKAVGNGIPADRRIVAAFNQGMREVFASLLNVAWTDEEDLDDMLKSVDNIISALERHYAILTSKWSVD